MRHCFKALVAPLLSAFFLVSAPFAFAQDWEETLEKARSGKVFFHAWGGSQKVNAYLAWVASRLKAEHDVDFRHVKLSDTALAVSQILADKAAGNDSNGLIDLVWINGENFRTMKENGLLAKGFVERLPNSSLIAFEDNEIFLYDFNVPTEGYELPWGLSKLVFVRGAANQAPPLRSLLELERIVADDPGRFTYPKPPDFTGSSFLKQLLFELIDDPEALKSEPSPAAFANRTAGFWQFLEKITPSLWNGGKAYPANEAALRQLFNDGELDYYFTFAPLSVTVDVANGDLPESVSIFVPDVGSIGNAHFVAIPYNSPNKDAAMVAADFLVSPEAQAKKQSLRFWGDFTVLDYRKLDSAGKAEFDALRREEASVSPEDLGKALPEPHPSWMEMIEEEWNRRIGGG